MIKMLILVCSIGIPEAKCLDGHELFTKIGPSFPSITVCRIHGSWIIEDLELLGLTHRIEASSFVRFRCVMEQVA